MNATHLYVQLSRLVVNLEAGGNSPPFELIERQLCKLRSLLLCRVCRDLRLDPYCSSFCQHIVCGACLKERKSVIAGCKWCRNLDDLSFNSQSKILILSYQRVCSALQDFLQVGKSNGTGVSQEMRRLQRFLVDAISVSKSSSEFIGSFNIPEAIELTRKRELASKCVGTDALSRVCQKCLCQYQFNKQLTNSDLVASDAKIMPAEVTSAHEEGVYRPVNPRNSPDYVSDAVSSTVPDSYIPQVSASEPRVDTHSKYSYLSQDADNSCGREDSAVYDQARISRDNLADENLNCHITKVTPRSIYGHSLNERKHRTIFEKIGLAVSTSVGDAESSSKKRHKPNLSEKDSKQRRSGKTVEFETMHLTPLKIKMRKISNSIAGSDCDASYSFEAFESKHVKKLNEAFGMASNPKFQRSRRCKHSSNSKRVLTPHSSDKSSNVAPTRPNLRKRKTQPLIQRLALSSESDIQSDIFDFQTRSFRLKKVRKHVSQIKNHEICGCGFQTKSLTNVCGKQRCPCFRRGKPCVNCNCRCCSNPYVTNQGVNRDSEGNSNIDRPSMALTKGAGPDIGVEVV